MAKSTVSKNLRNKPIRAAMRFALGGRCFICGTTETLEFDHIDPTTKLFEISVGLTNYLPEDDLWVEMDKCQLLCKIHHSKKTAQENTHRKPGARLTIEQVREIRRLYEEGERSQTELSRQFKIAMPTVNNIVHYVTWREDKEKPPVRNRNEKGQFEK